MAGVFDKIYQTFRQGAENIAAWRKVATTPALRQEYVSNVARPKIQNFRTDLPANVAYIQAKIGKRLLPHEYLPTLQQLSKEQNIPYNPLSPKNIPFEEPQITKSMSAELQTWPVAPPNPEIETLKQRILLSGVYRPAMQRYLSTVPVISYPLPAGAGMEGYADVMPSQTYDPTRLAENKQWETSSGPLFPVIGVSAPQNATEKQRPAEILAHEYAHATPRNMALKEEFINFFRKIKPNTHPLLWQVGLEYYGNGNPPPNPEEFYAIVAEKLGPNVLKIPEIRKFYENLFKE